MGNYVFTTDVLLDALRQDAMDPSSKHDMGGNIIPMLVERGEAQVYDFRDNDVPGSTERDRDYWRDVGTLDAFYDAHTDLISVHPVFNLYNNDWPIYTLARPAAAGEVRARRRGPHRPRRSTRSCPAARWSPAPGSRARSCRPG